MPIQVARIVQQYLKHLADIDEYHLTETQKLYDVLLKDETASDLKKKCKDIIIMVEDMLLQI
jgi:hypothetical protein